MHLETHLGTVFGLSQYLDSVLKLEVFITTITTTTTITATTITVTTTTTTLSTYTSILYTYIRLSHLQNFPIDSYLLSNKLSNR